MINDIKKKPIIWTISGSDCSGGAGIAADIKTGHGLGVEVCHLITANTVQNSQQLSSVNAVPVEILDQQVEALIDDKQPSVIKIGLLATVEQVQWLALLLQQYKQKLPNLLSVYDPVGHASVGGHFNTLTLTDLIPLLKTIDVITPNLMEAKNLSNLLKAESNNTEFIAKKIYQDFKICSVIIKGGHAEDKSSSIDYCYHQLNQLSDEKQDNQEKRHEAIEYQLSSARITTNYSDGGGCSFATALASFLAKGYLIRDAFSLAKAFINQGLASSALLSESKQHQYYGPFEQQLWPRNKQYFPSVIDPLSQKYKTLPAFNSLDLSGEKLGLYPVIDSIYWLKRLLPLGLQIIQLRVKNLSEHELEQVITQAVKLAKAYKTRLFINDYWKLAIKHGAYGVHIGQEDLQEADLDTIQRSGIRLGISTHGCYEFLLAQQLRPSYLAIGAIFPTKTKDMTGQIQGIDNLKQVLALRPENKMLKIPVVAIGGISLARVQSVIDTGVDSIAVVTAITEAESTHFITPEQAVSKFQSLLHQN